MLDKFTKRLAKIGITLTYIGNYPWVYLDTVNGKKVKGTFMANHGFTAFMLNLSDDDYRISDRRVLFNKIREML